MYREAGGIPRWATERCQEGIPPQLVAGHPTEGSALNIVKKTRQYL